jgi:pyrroloquinoline quinone (PQQ) biosynthesis protein C
MTATPSSELPAPLPADLLALVDEVLRTTAARQNPFFVALEDGDLDHAAFVATQVQFFHAVVAFHRPMASVAARIDDDGHRARIFRNVHEELGEGDPAKAHGATFTTFLARLTSTSEREVRARLAAPAGPAVRAFNAVVQGACVVEDVVVGAATMGIIERMFSEISSWIGRACVARGFLAASDMIHYDLHERLDVRHAEDFFRILADAWADPAGRRHVEDGLRLGAFAFDRLYRDLLEATRRP